MVETQKKQRQAQEYDNTLKVLFGDEAAEILPRLVPGTILHSEKNHAGTLHDRAVKAYRACVRFYRELGKSYDEAQRLALVG